MTNRKIMMRSIGIISLAFLVILCLYLAKWQIERGNEKDLLYNSYQKNISLQPQVIDELSEYYNNFTKIKVSGELLPENQFLLDNKVYKRKAGYDVITPMLVNDKILLVNRGWVDGNNRLTMPDIDIATINTDVEGYTYEYKEGFMLKDESKNTSWPRLIQSVNIKEISEALDKEVFSYSLIMSTTQINSLQLRETHQKNDKLKHYMYAGQWFIFSIIGFILIIVLLKRTKNE
tara:strand:- start:88 stop:786 length:699 start_codon:yes stop_codon:yes gene_type:complete